MTIWSYDWSVILSYKTGLVTPCGSRAKKCSKYIQAEMSKIWKSKILLFFPTLLSYKASDCFYCQKYLIWRKQNLNRPIFMKILRPRKVKWPNLSEQKYKNNTPENRKWQLFSYFSFLYALLWFSWLKIPSLEKRKLESAHLYENILF